MSEAKVIPLPRGLAVSNLKRIDKKSLVAIFDVEILAWHAKLVGCCYFVKDGHGWVSLPSKSFTNKDGKTIYTNTIEFTEKATAERFQNAVLAAVKELTTS